MLKSHKNCAQSIMITGASLSEPHHRRSTVKSVFLLARLLAGLLACVIPYMDDSGLHKYKLKHINGPLIPFKCQP